MYIKLTLLAFDKGGNPHQFKDLPKEKENPNKSSAWHPCLFEGKDEFIGPIFVKDPDSGKTKLLEAKELVRMKSWSWPVEQIQAATNRMFTIKHLDMYMDTRGVCELVPVFDGKSLKEIPWK